MAGALIVTILSCAPKKSENLFDDEMTRAAIPVELIDQKYDKPEPEKISDMVVKPSAEPASVSHTIKMNCVLQTPELPTGCEVTALTTVLNYMGYNVSKTDLAKNYLKTGSLGKVTFDEAFVGSPFSDGGYGCFAPVIVETAQKYLIQNTMDVTAWNISGTEFDDLFEYIDKDIPVIVWASMNLMDVEITDAYYDQNEKAVKWYNNEHCMVLCGYDQSDNSVIVADPLKGTKRYDKDRFRMIYNQLDKQAVIIK